MSRIETFKLSVCPETGDPGCMDCIEGQCPGIRQPHGWRTAHCCSECDADDVYGELTHEESCSLAAPDTRETT